MFRIILPRPSFRFSALAQPVAFAFAMSLTVGAQEVPSVQPTAVTDQNRTGPLPFSSSVSSPVDTLDLASGSLSLRIPILSVPGRKLAYNIALLYNGNFWVPAQNATGTYYWMQENRVKFAGSLGWSPNQASISWSYIKQAPFCQFSEPAGTQQTWTSYMFTDEDGAKHRIDAGSGTGRCPNDGGYSYKYGGPAVDSSGFWLGPYGVTLGQAELPSGNFFEVFDASGNKFAQGGAAPTNVALFTPGEGHGTIVDPRGNTVNQFAGGTDTLGRTLLTSSTPNANEVLYTFLDANGTQQSVTITLSTIPISTNFGVYADTAQTQPIHEAVGSATVISAITLPNGNAYRFTYESGYGGLQSVILPDGGEIDYVWSTLSFYGQTRRYVSQRTVKDGTNTSTWQLSVNESGASVTNSTVVDPNQNSSSYTSQFGKVSSAAIYQGPATGTPLARYTINYFSPASGSTTPTIPQEDGLPAQIITTLANNMQSKTEYDYDQYSYQSTSCDPVTCMASLGVSPVIADNPASRGNVEVRRDYDWGSGAPGSLLRQTVNHYAYEQYPNYFVDTNAVVHNIVDKISEQDIYDGASTCHYGASCTAHLLSQTLFTYDGESGQLPVYGEVAHVKRWLNTSGSYLTSGYGYDTYGNITSEVDANGNTTTFSYTDSWAVGGCVPASAGNAFVTQRTDALSHSTNYSYNSCSGQLHSMQDPNDLAASRAGTVYSYDRMNRVSGVMYPDGGQRTTTYNDTAHSATTVQPLVAGGTSISRTVFRDGLGRQKQMVVNTDPQGPSSVETTYDPVGRMQSVTNLHHATFQITDGTVSYAYDALGRMLLACNQDNVTTGTNVPCAAGASYRHWLYTGNTTDIYDEAQHHRQQVSDGLGRLVDVKEPDGSNSPTIETKYTYDVLSNLIGVNQLGASGNTPRVRSFTYDSLSQLITANNPETGTVCYGQWSGSSCVNGYDGNGNLQYRTDARGVVTHYSYDALNRVITKSYPTVPAGIQSTSNVNYLYDVAVGGWGWPAQTSPSYPSTQQTNLVGRLSQVTLGTAGANAWTVYSYDAMGRTNLKSECLPIDCGNNHHDIHYRYDLAGNLTFYDRGYNVVENSVNPNQGFYFGGFTQTYDGAGNLSSVTGDTAGTNRATNILSGTDYFPNGQLYTATKLGIYSDKYSVTNRSWYTGEVVTDPSARTVWQTSAHRINTGTVNTTTDTVVGNWSYTYDPMNRLQTAAGPTGHLSYTIDAFGNKSLQTVTSGTGPSPQGYQVAANNALTGNGLTYDQAGNVTNDGFHRYAYDVEGRLYQVDGTTCYIYDGDGDRVARTNCNVSGVGFGTITGVLAEFLYDTGGRLLAEVNAGTQQMANGNIWAGGQLVAQDAPDPNVTTATATQLRITDQVGSLRGLLDLGEHVVQSCTSFPFGDGATCSSPADQFFTGKERDAETSLDYFGARYYNSTLGRFMSPDWADKPEAVPYSDLMNPQSLNLYGYVNNNPLSKSDLDGHQAVLPTPLGPIPLPYPMAPQQLTPQQAGQVAQDITNFFTTAGQVIREDAATISNAVSNIFTSSNGPATPAVQPGQKDADFVVTPSGTAIATDPSRVRDSLTGAPGVTTTPITSPSGETGTMHTGVQTPNGPVDVRTMDGSSTRGPRTVITHPGTNNPKTPDGKATNDKNDNHIPNDHMRPQ